MKKINKHITLATLAAALIFTLSFLYFSKPSTTIGTYCPDRDKQLILDSFKTDWYWLIPDEQPNFDPTTVLPENGNNDFINILIENQSPAGYITYHKENNLDWLWRIRFLNVKPDKRNKGYAEKLVQHAVEQAKTAGAKVVVLMTRTDNKAAQKVYKKLGFFEKPNLNYVSDKYTHFVLKF